METYRRLLAMGVMRFVRWWSTGWAGGEVSQVSERSRFLVQGEVFRSCTRRVADRMERKSQNGEAW